MLRIDIHKLIMFIELRHMNKKARQFVMRNAVNFYDLCMDDVHNRFKDRYIKLMPLGFSLVVQHRRKSLLLCYNKLNGRTKEVDMYMQLKGVEH